MTAGEASVAVEVEDGLVVLILYDDEQGAGQRVAFSPEDARTVGEQLFKTSFECKSGAEGRESY